MSNICQPKRVRATAKQKRENIIKSLFLSFCAAIEKADTAQGKIGTVTLKATLMNDGICDSEVTYEGGVATEL